MSQYGIAHIDETEDNPLGLLLDLADIGAHTLPEKYRPNLKALAEEATRQAKSDAWHEGFEAGWEEHENPGPFVNDIWDAKTPNPYRSQP